ncbi:hypothetical protein Acsp03_37780 [Actinomadura sp. NBRC 104412]|nr:hypothetical protein Acsp03_37780 [Actinomadura sp. NBRC 104412]
MSPKARREFAAQLQAITERLTAIEARLERYEQRQEIIRHTGPTRHVTRCTGGPGSRRTDR